MYSAETGPARRERKLGLMKELGATAAVAVNASGRVPQEMIRLYGEEVLPGLQGA